MNMIQFYFLGAQHGNLALHDGLCGKGGGFAAPAMTCKPKPMPAPISPKKVNEIVYYCSTPKRAASHMLPNACRVLPPKSCNTNQHQTRENAYNTIRSHTMTSTKHHASIPCGTGQNTAIFHPKKIASPPETPKIHYILWSKTKETLHSAVCRKIKRAKNVKKSKKKTYFVVFRTKFKAKPRQKCPGNTG